MAKKGKEHEEVGYVEPGAQYHSHSDLTRLVTDVVYTGRLDRDEDPGRPLVDIAYDEGVLVDLDPDRSLTPDEVRRARGETVDPASTVFGEIRKAEARRRYMLGKMRKRVREQGQQGA